MSNTRMRPKDLLLQVENKTMNSMHSLMMGGSIGLCFFLFMFGLYIIQPQHITWLLDQINQDSIQHFVGWEFFRNEGWHFPLGLITDYGYPVSTSIVYTDSIPVLALIFKLFSPFLPENFQYFGLWYVTCFILQGAFAWAIASCMTNNKIIKGCITLFFLLSPIMLNRMVEHQALVAHWLILAAFLLYIRPYHKNSTVFWLGLNTFAVLIHAYLTFMVLAIWVAYLIRHVFIEKNITVKRASLQIILNSIVLFCVAWLTGYFVIPLSSAMDAGGYAMNSLNLLAPFEPTTGSLLAPQHWSHFINTMSTVFVEQGSEGFNYFGIGMVVLLLIALGNIGIKHPDRKTIQNALPLFIVCFIFFLYSISNVVYLGQWQLYSLPLFKFTFVLTDLFRASGRFFWPMYYGAMILTFMILVSRIKNTILIPVLLLSLILQFVDLSPKLMELHNLFNPVTTTQAEVDFSALNSRDAKYKSMVFIPPVVAPHKMIKRFGDYIHYAATHHMTVNLGYFARQDNSQYRKVAKQTLVDLTHGKYSDHTLYIIVNQRITMQLKSRLDPTLMMIRLGDYDAITTKV